MQGYAVITIAPNDLSNGVIGFSEDSRDIAANEDTSPDVTLKLARTEAFFGEVEVSRPWPWVEPECLAGGPLPP